MMSQKKSSISIMLLTRLRQVALSVGAVAAVVALLAIVNALENARVRRQALLTARGDSTDQHVVVTDAYVTELEARGRRAAEQRARDSVLIARLAAGADDATHRADSLEALIPDTAMMVTRSVHDAIVVGHKEAAAIWQEAYQRERKHAADLAALVAFSRDTVVPNLRRERDEYREQRDAWKAEAGKGLFGLGRLFDVVGLGATCGVGYRGTDCVVGATVRF